MPMIYTVARIFTSEGVRHEGRPLYLEIVEQIRRLRIPARCHVVKGVAGCYENGEVATHGVEVLSCNLPLEITVILPRAESGRVLPLLESLVGEGLMTVEEREVYWHKARRRLVPPMVRVKDVMTARPRTLGKGAPATEAFRILLGAPYHGLPVVDDQSRPVGMVTHGDLFRRWDESLKVGLMDPAHSQALAKALEGLSVADVMGRPVVTTGQEDLLSTAVDQMLAKGLKRLPVVDGSGILKGILSRLDVFRTIMAAEPAWIREAQSGIRLEGPHCAADAMRLDTPTLPPEAPLEDALELIDTTSVRRVAVVDAGGVLRGLVSDRTLLGFFATHKAGFLEMLKERLSFRSLAERNQEVHAVLASRTVADVMRKDLVTVWEETPLAEALGRMVELRLKRIPVVDGQGRFRGMLTRDSILRAGS
jgi:CBS domain-containing protein